MKKIFALLLTLAMVLGLLAGCGGTSGDSAASDDAAQSGETATGDKVVRIGVFEPATGDSGPGGKQEMLGMQYANKETPTVDIGGETYTVELVYADNGSDSSKAITAAPSLRARRFPGPGLYGSGVSIAAGPTFDEAGLAPSRHLQQPPGDCRATTTTSRHLLLDPFPGHRLANCRPGRSSRKKAYLLGELGLDEYDQGPSPTSSRPLPPPAAPW